MNKQMPGPDDRIGLRIKILANQITRAVDFALSGQGVTPFQSHILAFLDREGENGPVFQRDLERRFDIRRSTATGILNLMEKNGLILRRPVEEDKRLKELVLTGRATQLLQVVRQHLDAAENRLSSSLTGEEKTELLRLLDKLSQAAAQAEA